MGLSATAVPYTGPYGKPESGHKAKGPTAEALKRAMKRAGFGFESTDLGDLDEHYNDALESALDRWDSGANGYGEGRWEKIRNLKCPEGTPNEGTWALDSYAQSLIQSEAAPTTDEKKATIRSWITDFCKKGIANGSRWNYTQNRPVDITVDPTGNVNSDCSGSVIQAYRYAKSKSGYAVPDPAKQGWSGYGNTDYYEDDHPTVTGSYQVGDLAHYNGHVCLCMKAGNAETADWWSFGSEPPSKRKLNYRSDFRKVVRPPLL